MNEWMGETKGEGGEGGEGEMKGGGEGGKVTVSQ